MSMAVSAVDNSGLLGATPGSNVEKMIIEPFISRSICFRSLMAGVEEPKKGQCPRDRLGARKQASLDRHHIDAKGHTDGGNAGRRSRLGLIRYQAGSRVDFITKELECCLPETFEHFRIGALWIRILHL